VKQVANSGGYMVVLEADPSSPGHTVLFAADAVDVTSQVITYLNGHPSAPASTPASAGHAAAKSKAEAAPAKKSKK